MRCVRAMTIVELLAVVAVVAVLLALLLPQLSRARQAAVRVKCQSALHQLGAATHMYALHTRQRPPDRSRVTVPQQVRDTAGSDWNLNDSLLEPYLGNREAAFCPSSLLEVRNPHTASPDYRSNYVTYQFFHLPDAYGTWLSTANPAIASLDRVQPSRALWSCLTVNLGDGRWLGHDRAFSKRKPEGMNAAYADGSARWTTLASAEPCYLAPDGSQMYYWPAP